MRPITICLSLTLLAFSISLAYAQTVTPQWNPFTNNCENTPALDDPAAAQCRGRCFGLSAPRVVAGPTRPGEVVELSLWETRGLVVCDGFTVAPA